MKTNCFRLIKPLFIILPLFVTLACKEAEKQKISQGHLIYEIDFPDIDPEERPIIFMLLPKKQDYVFKNNVFHSNIKRATFELNVIVDTKEQNFYSDLRFNEKYHTILNSKKAEDILNVLPKYKVEFTEEKDTLLGLDIHKAVVQNKELGEFDVWYTEDIVMDSPNWYNPYREIPGVLMKYKINQNGTTMNFTATQLDTSPIEDEHFAIEPKGKAVDFLTYQKYIDELFNNLLN